MVRKRLGLAALVWVAALCGSAAAWDKGESTDNAETTIASPLQGSWVMVSIEIMGMKVELPQGQEPVFTFKGDKLLVNQAMRKEEGAYKLNDSKMPKEIDLIDLNKNGKDTLKGIYRLEGDTLKIAFTGQGNGGSPRPTAFTGKDVGTVIFKRKN
jgi:uncharacterized protein (TIGR03067 family)